MNVSEQYNIRIMKASQSHITSPIKGIELAAIKIRGLRYERKLLRFTIVFF